MKKVLIKRIASICLVIMMLITTLPVNALAEELATDHSDGGQTQTLPESFGDNLEQLVENEKVEFVKNSFTFRVVTDAQDGKPGTAEIIYFLDEREATEVNYGVIVIPETVNYLGCDYRVETVKSDAFDETLIIKALVMPDSITNVGEGLFEEKGRFTLYCNEGSFIAKYLQDKQYGWVTVVTDGIRVSSDKTVIKPDETAKAQLVHALSFLQNQPIEWESSAPAFASVDESGTITGISPGIAKITGKLAGLKASFDCTVNTDKPVSEIDTQRSVQSLTASEADSDFVIENGVLTKYLGNATEVVIPEEVTVIGAEAFQNNQSITHVRLPSGLVKIGDRAFEFCTNLDDQLIFPETLSEIGEGAYDRCSKIWGTLVIPQGVKVIKNYAFRSCSSLNSLKFSEGFSEIGYQAFNNCSGLSGQLILPQSLNKIGELAFAWCTRLTGELVIPDNVTEIGSYAFSYCYGLSGILTVSSKLQVIGVGAFTSCNNISEVVFTGNVPPVDGANNFCNPFMFMPALKTVWIPKGTYALYSAAFGEGLPQTVRLLEAGNTDEFVINDGVLEAYLGTAGQVTIPEGIRKIGAGAFLNNSTITQVSLPSSLKIIDQRAFFNCSNLSGELVFPLGIEEIGDYAYYNCSKLSGNLIFPEGVTKIGEDAFRSCTGFDGALILPESLLSIGNRAFSECLNLKGGLTIPQKVTRIGEGVFLNCSGLNGDLVVPIDVTFIGSNAFSGCSGFNGELRLSDKITIIGMNAFSGCSNLQGCLTISEQVTNIGEFAFNNCKKISEVIFQGENPPEHGEDYWHDDYSNFFYEMTSLETVWVPKDTYNVYQSAYGKYLPATARIKEIGCENDFFIENGVLRAYLGDAIEVTIPDGVTEIGEGAFLNNQTITHIVLPESLVKIGNQAFKNCAHLNQTLLLPAKLSEIGEHAYSGCTGLTGDLLIPDSVTKIGMNAFSECTGLNGQLYLSKNLETINYNAFLGCSNLSGKLIVPDSVKEIKDCAFRYCSGITEVVLGKNVNSIGTYSFDYCNSIQTLVFNGEVPPSIFYPDSFFGFFANLGIIYCHADLLDSYQSAYRSHVKSSVKFLPDTTTLAIKNLKADKIYSKRVVLTWEAIPNIESIRYQIYRNNSDQPIATTEEATFTDTLPQSNQTIQYTVLGVTADGKKTNPASLEATTAEPEMLEIKTNHDAATVNVMDSQLFAKVRDTGNLDALGDEKTTGIFYYVDQNNAKQQIGAAQTAYEKQDDGSALYHVDWDLSQIEPSTYAVIFELTDVDGACSYKQKEITIEDTRPDQITNLVAFGDTNQIVLSWTIAHEISTDKYCLYRKAPESQQFVPIRTIEGRCTLTYTDNQVETDTRYEYYIVGVNNYNQESLPSKTIAVTSEKDLESPQIAQLTPASGMVLGDETELYARAIDNVAVTRIALYLSEDNGVSWVKLSENDGSYCRYRLNTKAVLASSIMVKALAYDAAGNESGSFTNTYQIDNVGPEKVIGLSYDSTATTAVIRWADVVDNDLAGFRLERQNPDGSFSLVQSITKTLGANVVGLTPNSTYVYRVAAYDRLGNIGVYSELLSIVTAMDSVPPVITKILPGPGYYVNQIPLRITAEDDSSLEKVMIQISRDAISWQDQAEISASGNNTSETVAHTLDISSFEEGNLFVRAIAVDRAGNQGDSSSETPYVQYAIDRTAPAVPQNVSVSVNTGAIEIAWSMGTEEDLGDYVLYRSLDAVNFVAIANNIQTLNYWDRSIEKDKTYFYCLAVKDLAGNESGKSTVVSGQMSSDTEAPVIESIFPADGSSIGAGNSVFGALVSDNWKLQSIKLSYAINNEAEKSVLTQTDNVDNYYKRINCNLPMSKLKNGDTLYLTIEAEDAFGLRVSQELTYFVDLLAPVVTNVSVNEGSDAITLTWSSDNEPDLAGFRIFRKDDEQSYKLIGQRSVQNGASQYSFIDSSVELNQVYSYKIEAVDKNGNCSNIETKSVWLQGVPQVEATLKCDRQQEVNVEYQIDGSDSFADLGIATYEFDFGDGEIKTQSSAKIIHHYQNTGNYTIRLKVTDKNGETAETSCEISVLEPQLLGTVLVKTVDVAGNPISGIPIYFDIDNTEGNIKQSNASGEAVFTSKAEKRSIGAYADGYLPVKKSLIVRAGTQTELIVTMIKQPIVTGQFEINRMTLDEIKAAGVDVSNPANQQVMKVRIFLQYGSQPLEMSVISNGGNTNINNTIIVDTDAGQRKVTATVVKMNSSNGNGSGSGIPGGGSGGGADNDDNVIIALMDVPVEASFLKEFFDVKLHLINHASPEFNLSHNQITLNVPTGMSIVKTAERQNAEIVTFDQFAGQEEKTIDWVLRGDQAGEYDLTANYNSILDQFNQPVEAEFKTAEPIKVYGLTGVKLIAEINSTIREDALYFNLGLENKNGVDLNLPAIDVTESLIRQFEISNKYREKAVTVELLNSTLHNSSGFQQFLGTGQIPDILHVGETYTKKYVAYNAIEYDDVAYLQKTIEAFAKEQGFEVEIRNTQLDLFDLSLPEEKIAKIRMNQDLFNIYNRIIDIDNNEFYYQIQACKDDSDNFKKWNVALYRSTDLVLNFDIDYFTNDKMEEIARKIICDLLVDESFGEVVNSSIDETYIKITKSMLSTFSGILGSGPEDASSLEIINSIANDGNSVRQLAANLKSGGEKGFCDRLIALVGSQAGSVGLNISIRKFYDTHEVAEWYGDEIAKNCKDISKVVKVLDELVGDWNQSAEITQQMIMINANQEESKFLLDTILKYDYLDSAILQEADQMKGALNAKYIDQSDYFCSELTKTVLELGGGELLDQAFKVVDLAFNVKAGSVYDAMGLVFNLFDYTFDWEGQVEVYQKLRVFGALTLAFSYSSVDALSKPGKELDSLRSLKYLIKIRLNGEKAYIQSAKKYANENDFVKKINKDQNKLNKIENQNNAYNYTDLDDYYDDFSNRLLSERDTLFNKSYTIATIPEAPKVSIDYENESTNESFGLDYEYSFDGVDWVTCMLKQIKLEPVMVSRYLWVRKKASMFNPAGNITKMIIPSRNRIRDDITVKYQDGKYLVSGLSDGDYTFLAAEDGTVEMNEKGAKLTIINNTAMIEKPLKSYLLLRKTATEKGFASQVKSYQVEKIAQKEVERIALIQLPKTEYKIGETLDVSNGKINVFYDDGTQEVVPMTKEMCRNFNTNLKGKQIITITVSEKSTTYEVLVNSGSPPISSPDTNPEPIVPPSPSTPPEPPISPGPTTPPVPEPGSAANIDEKKAIDEIERADEGSKITIGVRNGEAIPISILEAAKGKDIMLVFDFEDYFWEISGTSITNLPEGLTAYDISVKSIQNETLTDLANDPDAIQFEISHDGALPFTGRLTYKIDVSFNGKLVSLYYYNESNGKLEYQDQSTVGNGAVSFKFSHASKYVISATMKPEEAVINCTYQTQLENVGWQEFKENGEVSGTVGESLRLEGIKIKTDEPKKLGITYQTHVQNVGWQGFKNNGEMSGTSGEGLRLEAIQIKLTGVEANQYDLYYQVYTEQFGWLDWAKNGESAGSEGYGYRLEAIRILIQKKGSEAPGSMEKPFKKNIQCVYQTHVQNIGWQGFRSNGEMSGTSGQALRLEGIEIKFKDVKKIGVQYSTHVENLGWQNEVKDGAMSGTTGQGLRLEAIKIRLTGEDANKYDIYYQVHAQNFGWLDWAKNGDSAGTAGYGYRLEAIKIVVVPKGASGPGEAVRPFLEMNKRLS
ncbi:leucine-rich repeat protein [Acetobacterium malicum]|uniref:leucine-rich repeat protein n=1 Tax=Acetobacterium malicum TaxID=52692 RepID=UPI00054E1B63|nr:leucine-rich repeat protein [Acetobacterium dehalogenans]